MVGLAQQNDPTINFAKTIKRFRGHGNRGGPGGFKRVLALYDWNVKSITGE